MRLLEHSTYVPQRDHRPPRPAWKDFEDLRDVLPQRDRLPPQSGEDD